MDGFEGRSAGNCIQPQNYMGFLEHLSKSILEQTSVSLTHSARIDLMRTEETRIFEGVQDPGPQR